MINKFAILKLEFPKIIIETFIVVSVALASGASDILVAFLISSLIYAYARIDEISLPLLFWFSSAIAISLTIYLFFIENIGFLLFFDFENLLENKKIFSVYVFVILFIQSAVGNLFIMTRRS